MVRVEDGKIDAVGFLGHHEAGKNLERKKNPHKKVKEHAHTRQAVL